MKRKKRAKEGQKEVKKRENSLQVAVHPQNPLPFIPDFPQSSLGIYYTQIFGSSLLMPRVHRIYYTKIFQASLVTRSTRIYIILRFFKS